MFINKKNIFKTLLSFSLVSSSTHSHDVLLEIKGAAFIPTNDCFKRIYGKSAGIFGAEVTFNAWDNCECGKWLSNFYGFVSADFLSKSGNSIGLCTPTKAEIATIGIGIKYLFPFYCADLYLGIGALPTHLRTKNCSPYVIQKTSDWSCGGIAKFGAFIDLPCSFFLDLFVDYQFVTVKPKCCPTAGVQFHNAALNGVIAGAGLGYRFN